MRIHYAAIAAGLFFTGQSALAQMAPLTPDEANAQRIIQAEHIAVTQDDTQIGADDAVVKQRMKAVESEKAALRQAYAEGDMVKVNALQQQVNADEQAALNAKRLERARQRDGALDRRKLHYQKRILANEKQVQKTQ